MPRYRVPVTTLYYDYVEVAADSPEQAREKAKQAEPSGMIVSEAEIGDPEPLRMDYDEALTDAGLL